MDQLENPSFDYQVQITLVQWRGEKLKKGILIVKQ